MENWERRKGERGANDRALACARGSARFAGVANTDAHNVLRQIQAMLIATNDGRSLIRAFACQHHIARVQSINQSQASGTDTQTRLGDILLIRQHAIQRTPFRSLRNASIWQALLPRRAWDNIVFISYCISYLHHSFPCIFHLLLSYLLPIFIISLTRRYCSQC